MNWISVKDQPIPTEWSLTFHEKQGRIIAKTVEGGLVEECCCCTFTRYYPREEFTHWMPLPEPPKDQ